MIVDVTTGPPTGITGYTADSGFTLLGTSNIVGTACQYGIQTTHGAINPGITVAQSGSDSFATITIALKNASAGTARPANMLTVGELHIPAYASVITTTMTIQYPTFGNLLVARFLTFSVAAAATVSTITDNKGNVWHNRAGPVSGLNEVQNEIWSADNATTGSDYTMTVTWGASLAGTTGGDTHIVLDDVINAGVFDVGATNTGTQSSAGNLDTVVITPTTSGGKIFCEGDIFSHTASGTAGAAISDIYVSPVFDGGGNDLDEDALWAHIDNTDTTAKTFTFTIQHNTTGVQGWGAVAAAFKLPVANNQIWLIKA
jgi:hypothetical protein